MNCTNELPDDVFLNVRKAYRLLHDYQRMVMDVVNYMGSQLDMPYNGGWSRFSGDARSGYAKLSQSPWDWLAMVFYEFHFVKNFGDNGFLSLSFLVISDSGFAEGDGDKETPSEYAKADESSTKFAFILRNSHWDPLPFVHDKTEMKNFIKAGGCLPDDLCEKGFAGKCYDMRNLTSESGADKVVGDVIAFAEERSWPLELKKRFPATI